MCLINPIPYPKTKLNVKTQKTNTNYRNNLVVLVGDVHIITAETLTSANYLNFTKKHQIILEQYETLWFVVRFVWCLFIHSDYEINKNGKIRHNITKKILKQTETNGYVTVSINGETMYFHRLIYEGLTVQIIIRTFELSDKMMMSVTDQRYIKNIAVLKLRTGATLVWRIDVVHECGGGA